MTRHEIAIASAKRAVCDAEAALSKAYERKREAVRKASERTTPSIWASSRKVLDARRALAMAELAAIGIMPMKTIILWHPKGYTSPLARFRYAVRIDNNGWKRLVPVGRAGSILSNRAEQSPPSKWDEVIVTTDEVKE